jgi:glycosyltransferase involved in cell wall biosynthesis
MSGNGAVRVATIITRLEGGAGQHALRGALSLDPASFEMTIITGSGDPLLLDQAAAAGLEVLTEPALRMPISPRSDLRALARLQELFTRRPFDIVHTHTAKAGVLGRLAAHRAGVPRLVHTYHGFPFHEFQGAPRRQAYVRIERRLGRITDLALCVGTGVAVEAVRRRLISPERIRTIGVVAEGPALPHGDRNDGAPNDGGPNGGAPADGAPADGAPGDGSPNGGAPNGGAPNGSGPSGSARARARAALGLPADATVVGAVGRLTYQKAPGDFVAALRALDRPDVTGVWVGDGELAGKVATQVRDTPGVRVVLAGQRGNVLELLPAFDVFALPSRYEGLPTAVVEAMACGIPVVATAVNAVGDVVVPGETGLLVPPGRPGLMADAVGFLLDSPEVAAGMAAAAQARLGKRFGEEALRQALTAAYAAGGATA